MEHTISMQPSMLQEIEDGLQSYSQLWAVPTPQTLWRMNICFRQSSLSSCVLFSSRTSLILTRVAAVVGVLACLPEDALSTADTDLRRHGTYHIYAAKHAPGNRRRLAELQSIVGGPNSADTLANEHLFSSE